MNNKKKNQKEMVALGSRTAKAGFSNEQDIVDRFNNWRQDTIVQKWLLIMGYLIEDIQEVKAIKVKGTHKADIQIKVSFINKSKSPEIQNIQIKLVSNIQGFNQVDKRWVDGYVSLWNISQDVAHILKYFTGEINSRKKGLRDSRRMFLDEMDKLDQAKVIAFFNKQKASVVADVLRGRGEFSADWTLVIVKTNGELSWVLKSIDQVIKIFEAGDVQITSQGSLKIGNISMQRKGGDRGRKTAQMLQFKINPVLLFSVNKN